MHTCAHTPFFLDPHTPLILMSGGTTPCSLASSLFFFRSFWNSSFGGSCCGTWGGRMGGPSGEGRIRASKVEPAATWKWGALVTFTEAAVWVEGLAVWTSRGWGWGTGSLGAFVRMGFTLYCFLGRRTRLNRLVFQRWRCVTAAIIRVLVIGCLFLNLKKNLDIPISSWRPASGMTWTSKLSAFYPLISGLPVNARGCFSAVLCRPF